MLNFTTGVPKSNRVIFARKAEAHAWAMQCLAKLLTMDKFSSNMESTAYEAAQAMISVGTVEPTMTFLIDGHYNPAVVQAIGRYLAVQGISLFTLSADGNTTDIVILDEDVNEKG